MGVDTSSEPGFSKVSVNGGNSFQFESRFLAGLKGEYMIRLVLYRTQQEVSVDFSKKKDISRVELQNGAVIKDDAAVFDGMKSAAVLRDSEGLNVTEKGLTISGVVRMEPCAAKKDHADGVQERRMVHRQNRKPGQFQFFHERRRLEQCRVGR